MTEKRTPRHGEDGMTAVESWGARGTEFQTLGDFLEHNEEARFPAKVQGHEGPASLMGL